MCCLQHEGTQPQLPLHPIVSTALMDLLCIDFTSIETTMDVNRPPKITNILVFQDHFTKHGMVYVTPDQTTKTVTKFLYQGYISIFRALAKLLSDCSGNFMSHILVRCVNSLVWRHCKPYLLSPPNKQDWWRGPIKLSCIWLRSCEKIRNLTGQII